MEQSLDRLRSKELTFGCKLKRNDNSDVAIIGEHTENENENHTFVLHYQKDKKEQPRRQRQTRYDITESGTYTIIWHPLTRGRINYVLYSNEVDYFPTVECFQGMHDMFMDYPELYDQNETQRMKHEKRTELLKLLEEFALLIPDDNGISKTTPI